jgi:DNA-binding PucR family transcriptional regulator
LIYRLDKVRRATGLDLKKFEDAVVFRFLMSFSERPDIYEKNKKEGLV